ncbi:PREDICTED: fanconi-associated nuclease 1-like isoform X1 [Papilio xuthus]|uniref:Fanconi-associated nuclease n=1 Tax=Papilio xuthus TaxID=66420 RepID=A0AAJ7E534_PAPXU|nr:PREDICTED: fanconi-associated nuclease 1-like isoform X1 [Papilio xuthus]
MHVEMITDYYKINRSKVVQNMDGTPQKRYNLSLKSTTPNKMVKTDQTVDVIDLCSDEETDTNTDNTNSAIKSSPMCLRFDDSDTTNSTILYTPKTPTNSYESTPKKINSPGTSKKFFSPTKNRLVNTPQKAKKNLHNMFNSSDGALDESFPDEFKSYDDKTMFLLKIIHNYLYDEPLRKLLPESVHNLLSKTLEVVKPGMRLICRLFWRKRCWYRREDAKKIAGGDNNIDDPHFEFMINSLVEQGFIKYSANDVNCMTFDDYVEVLKLNELKDVCKDLNIKVKTKQEAITSLKNFISRTVNISNYFKGEKSSNANRGMEKLRLKAGKCYRLSESADVTFTKLYYLMYFGIDYSIIRESKLELILLNSKVKKEIYPINDDITLDNASVVFNTSDEFESYMNAYKISQKWHIANTTDEKIVISSMVYSLYKNLSEEEWNYYKSLPSWLRKYTPGHIYIKLLEKSVPELKKMKEKKYIKQALKILTTLIQQSAFRQHKKSLWYAEKALILEKHENSYEKAAEVLLEGLKSDIEEDCKCEMRPRAFKLATLKCTELSDELRQQLLQCALLNSVKENDFEAKHIYKQPTETCNNRGKIKFETLTSDGSRMFLDAEEYCIEEYINTGEYTHGGHWEGRIISTIFFVLFWDIIYVRLPGVRGVFLSQLQMFPQDLFTDSFYVNRKALIDDRLREISNATESELLTWIQETWDARPEGELSGITRSIGVERVKAVCRCLGGAATSALCARLAKDYRRTHSGFPDLTLWNQITKQIKFVEVKTDSDKPSVKQLQWLRYLVDAGLRAEFCYVGTNTTRCKARAAPQHL